MIRSKTNFFTSKYRKGTNLLRTFNLLEIGETPSSVRQEDRRWEVLALLIDMKNENVESHKSAKFMSMANSMYKLLTDHFLPTVPPTQEQSLKEMSEMVFGRNGIVQVVPNDGKFDDPRWMTCYNATFAVLVIRAALKHFKLPIVQATNWKSFAVNYAGLVMAA